MNLFTVIPTIGDRPYVRNDKSLHTRTLLLTGASVTHLPQLGLRAALAAIMGPNGHKKTDCAW